MYYTMIEEKDGKVCVKTIRIFGDEGFCRHFGLPIEVKEILCKKGLYQGQDYIIIKEGVYNIEE